MSAQARPARGFSVIEVLVALLIVGLIMGAIYGALVGTLRTKQVLEEEMEDAKQSAVLFELLRRDIVAACPLRPGTVLFRCRDGRLTSQGRGSLNFLAARWSRFPEETERRRRDREGEDAPPRSALCEVGYFVRPDEDDRERFVLYRREDYYVDEDFEKGGTYLKLSSRVRELSLRFYPGGDEGEAAEPVRSWDGEKEKRLPVAVGIRLVVDLPAEDAGEGGDDEKVYDVIVPLPCGSPKTDEDEEGDGLR